MSLNEALLTQIHQVAVLLPPQILETVCQHLRQAPSTPSVQWTQRLLQDLPKRHFQRSVQHLLDLWYSTTSTLTGEALAAALESAAFSTTFTRNHLDVELVWTGPSSSTLPIRRTDQVLLQLIENCQSELILISFAIYKIKTVVKAVQSAINRGVAVRLIAETPESGEGKIPFGIEATFGSQMIQQCQVYIWPKHKRPTDTQGHYGSLHIKGAVADVQNLFITSANLTDYAMTLNMEMGVLLKSQTLGQQVKAQIDRLIHDEILVKIIS
ncbi:MAG: DISARM system phospholipase D-like protein DrmC [Microcoleaceae cyanobacterium]